MNKKRKMKSELLSLMNVGPAVVNYLNIVGIERISQLSHLTPKTLVKRFEQATGESPDPCLADTFAAVIHEAKTGERLPWWHWSRIRKQKQ